MVLSNSKPWILLWICRSIVNNLSEFKIVLERHSSHIVGLCETWLTNSVSSKFPNYNFVQKDRCGAMAGGLGF